MMTQKCDFCTQRTANGCGCEQKVSLCKEQITPVMAFVPWQTDGKMYPDMQALKRGTLYSVLDKPFWGIGGCCSGK